MEDKSFEQLVEAYTRSIRETRGKILDDFYKAYVAHMMEDIKDLSVDDICLVECQCDGPASINRKYWFEIKPRFPDAMD